jgi:uncharacterized surface protein with fasciclin (FAS1) repeats
MKKKVKMKNVCWSLILFFILGACESKMEEHYEVPKWAERNAWEVLQEQGNYSMFLQGAEKAGLKPILEGKGLVTVMAPNDEAFSEYIVSCGKSSIDDFTRDELMKLIGFHLIYYSYDKDKLINFRPKEGDGVTEEEKEIMAGLYYKHRTRSYDPPTIELDTNGREVMVYHNERLLPVFSYKLFSTKKIDAKYNYEYFYPNSEWTGNEGFNVSNAGVTEYDLIASNGYIDLIDQVLDPLETIYKELQQRDEYSRYLELYDRYSYYELDPQLTVDFGKGNDLYRHYHSPLPNIACEWPVSNFRDVANLSYMAYSVFAPSNVALNNFFDNYWQQGGYRSFDEVNSIAIKYLIYNTVYKESIVFPEEIKKGNIINSFDMKIDFDVDQVPLENRLMCTNGVLYGLNELQPPSMFTSITGPAFQQKDLSYYLYMLDASGMLIGLSSGETTMMALIPKNQQMIEGGIYLIDDALWSMEEGELAPLNTGRMTDIVNLHMVTGGEEIKSSGTQVFRTNLPYTYWYVNDGKIITSVLFNEKFINPFSNVSFVDLHPLTYNGKDWSNGKAFTYDYEEMFLPLSSSTSVLNQLAITRDARYPYFQFSELLRNAGLADIANGTLPFADGLRPVIFIPTNDALSQAISAGKIPGVNVDGSVSNQKALADYLKNYFVPTEANGMTTYPYIGSGIQGQYSTLGTFNSNETPVNTVIVIKDKGTSLSVQLNFPGVPEGKEVSVISDYDYFPFAFFDGGVHFIEDVF